MIVRFAVLNADFYIVLTMLTTILIKSMTYVNKTLSVISEKLDS